MLKSKNIIIDTRSLFLNHVAQTSPLPLMLEVKEASGMYITDVEGKQYLDLNSGISVSSLGHRHPNIVSAIEKQVNSYMHTMVYGEHLQSPQLQYAQLLTSHLDDSLDSVYFVNSGAEAIEGAMKLSKRATSRPEIIACRNAYHGSTQGAEALRSDDDFLRAFLPGLPGVSHIDFNDLSQLPQISEKTAAVILEPVQAEVGVQTPKNNFLKAVRQRCNETGTLMVLDEIQTGNGRTGALFAHQKYGVIPDIMTIAKSMGGGLPIGAFVANKELMDLFTKKPMLGHITTFGGNPVCCASAYAVLKTITEEKIHEEVFAKERLFHSLLKHPIIKEVRSSGLMMAVELTKRKYLKHVVSKTIDNGALIDYFLFNNRSFRLAPPLIINDAQIHEAAHKLLSAMDYAQKQYNK